MLLLLPFFLVSAVADVLTCLAAGWSGLMLAGMLLVLFAAYFVGALLLFVLLLWIISLFIDQDRPQRRVDRFYRVLVTYIMGLLTVLSRIRLHVNGLEKLPEGRWLFVCNHRSNYDPIVTGWALRGKDVAFISKPQNLRIPIVGKLIHKCCFLSIDRENDREALKTILAAIDLIRRDEASVAVYPEGTRNTAEEMLPFRNGVFKIAQKARVPIVVASIRGSDLVARRMPWRHTDVYLDIRTVMSAEEAAALKTNEIGDQVRQWIQGGAQLMSE